MVEKIKYDWYQSTDYVNITLWVKNLTEDDISVTMSTESVSVSIDCKSDAEKHPKSELKFDLWQQIDPQSSSYVIKSVKVEIKLRKMFEIKWNELVKKETPQEEKKVQIYDTEKWSSLERKIKQDEKDGKDSEEDPLNSLFKKVYGDGSDDTRRAMMKSFTESGGTVLSTNWSEVGKEQVERKTPDGLEWKRWD